jgi:formylglycine-generating enzyme required for sulfatase activity
MQDAAGLREVLADPRIGGFAVTECRDSPYPVWRERIVEFFSGASADEMLLLYISGHGLKDQPGRLYFAATDTHQDRLLANGIPSSFIDEAAGNSRSRRIVMIFDTCFSGAFAKGLRLKAGFRSVNMKEYFQEATGRIVITASDRLQYALAGDAQPSLFTKHVIEGLRTGAADLDGDGKVSSAELVQYVSTHMRRETPHQRPRRWAFDLEGDDFIIASNPLPQPARSATTVEAGRRGALWRRLAFAFIALVPIAGGAYWYLSSQPTVSSHHVGEIFHDCEYVCPEMVVIPSGKFQMGSPSNEQGRFDREGPVHEVSIHYSFAVGIYPVTRSEWNQYVDATKRSGAEDCNDTEITIEGDNYPVVCVTWEAAHDYAAWLSQKTGHHYRLLSEAEYEYVNRAGTSSAYFWGDKWDCRRANSGDASCNGGHRRTRHTSPVGSFPPNAFGLYDTTGNVFSWTADCWHDSYLLAPTDGSAWTTGGDCSQWVVRGGFFGGSPPLLRAAFRSRFTGPGSETGFRLARTLP